MNLNAIYFPEKNYSGFYDDISNVNQFRVLLNKEFEQHLHCSKILPSFYGVIRSLKNTCQFKTFLFQFQNFNVFYYRIRR